MTVRISEGGRIELLGDCSSDDAERLLQRLADRPNVTIDWRACTQAHTAVIQVLMAADAHLQGPPANDFLAVYVAPYLKQR